MRRLEPSVDLVSVFGPFKLIPSQGLLLRIDRPVKLGGRALDILNLLLMRAGEEVSADELIDFAWPGIFVDKRNLKVHVSSLRRALEDTLPDATYIATVVGRGYQFVGRVRTERVEIVDIPAAGPEAAGSFPSPSLLVGRRGEIEGIARALDTAMLVTLVGPGGVGKTSLAVAVAHARRDAFPDGIHFVDLSTTGDPVLVPHLLATALGVRGHGADLISAVAEHLRGKRLLIVLDNCEHVRAAAAALTARLVDAKLEILLLATSREPLGVSGEHLQQVEPLAFPGGVQVQNASDARAYASVELFVLRAIDAADYRLADGDVSAVADLCEALDGLPLAIEIAAANLDRFTPADLLRSFGRRLGELRNDDEDRHPRHRTLWATLDWSYQLLSPQEAATFRLLSVFAGSFDWDDVTRMARLVQYDPYQTTLALGGLVAKSLLSAEIDGDQLRYRLLDSARSYASEALQRDPLAEEARCHHARLVLGALANSEAEWSLVDSGTWRARYEPRIGDVRKALDWCFGEGGDECLGIDITITAIRLWNELSSIFEQMSRVETAMHVCPSGPDASRRMATLATARAWSMTLARQLDAETDEAWNAAVSFAERGGDMDARLSAMFGLAVFLIRTGRNERALVLLDTYRRIAEAAKDRASLFDGERIHAWAEMHVGRLVDARIKLERLAAELAHGVPPSNVLRYREERYVGIHCSLAFSTWLTGQPRHALEIVEEVVARTGRIGHLMGQSNMLGFVALPLAFWSGPIEEVERYSVMLKSNLERERISLWEPVQRFYAAVARHVRGDFDAVTDMGSAVEELVRDRFMAHTPMYFGILAEALLASKRPAEAREAIARALTLRRLTRENWCLPELLRVKARTMAAIGECVHARRILVRARENAVAIGARMLEWRILDEESEMAFADGGGRKSSTAVTVIQTPDDGPEPSSASEQECRQRPSLRDPNDNDLLPGPSDVFAIAVRGTTFRPPTLVGGDKPGHDEQDDQRRGGHDGRDLEVHVVPHLSGQRHLQAAADEQADRQLLEGVVEADYEGGGQPPWTRAGEIVTDERRH